MGASASISSSIAGRYATALFELSLEAGQIDALQNDISALGDALSGSAELRDLMSSPLYHRDQAQAAIGAVASAMGLSDVLANTLRLMASKRRLFVVPALVGAVGDLIAQHKGIVVADIVTARALSDEQTAKITQSLHKSLGKTVNLNATVDESLIGGLVLKVGSRMIDTSIRSKLNSLQHSMKEVG